MTRRETIVTYSGLTLMALFWGGTFIAGRIATAEMTPAAASLWRYLIGAVVLAGAACAFEGGLPQLSGRQWLGVVLIGATGVALFNLCFMFALARMPASRASLIMALNPAVTLLAAALFVRERLTRGKLAAIAVALVGVAVVLAHGNPENLLSGSVGIGEIVMFGCPVAWAANTLVAKRLLGEVSAIGQSAWGSISGVAMLAAVVAAQGDLTWPRVTGRVWIALLFLGIFGTAITLVLFYAGVRRIGAARASVFINLVPVFAVALGVAILHEPLDASMIVGGALVVGGILLLNRPAAPEADDARTHAA